MTGHVVVSPPDTVEAVDWSQLADLGKVCDGYGRECDHPALWALTVVHGDTDGVVLCGPNGTGPAVVLLCSCCFELVRNHFAEAIETGNFCGVCFKVIRTQKDWLLRIRPLRGLR